MANGASQQQLIPQMIEQIVQLMQQMVVLQQNIHLQSRASSSITSSSSSSLRSHRTRMNTQHYCWSDGACAHTSSQCDSKQPDHKDEATINNKMGGSTAYCPSAPSST